MAGGRTGPATVTWCAGSPAPTASFNPGCLAANETASGGAPLANGLIRYTATRNQFGGPTRGKTVGTAQVYFNAGQLTQGQVPCIGFDGVNVNPACLVAISQATPATDSVFGGAFGATNTNPADVNPTGVWIANIQTVMTPGGSTLRGAITALITPITTMNGVNPTGVPKPFTGQAASSWGFPLTTGMLTLSVTANVGLEDEKFVRTGFDGRNSTGSGLVTLVSGTVSNRSLSGSNGNRGWLTLRIPEPGVLAAGSAALLMLGGCHWLVRRRQR
jgi:hypothetical protein